MKSEDSIFSLNSALSSYWTWARNFTPLCLSFLICKINTEVGKGSRTNIFNLTIYDFYNAIRCYQKYIFQWFSNFLFQWLTLSHSLQYMPTISHYTILSWGPELSIFNELVSQMIQLQRSMDHILKNLACILMYVTGLKLNRP